MRFVPSDILRPVTPIVRVTAILGGVLAYLLGMIVLMAFTHVSSDLPDPSRLWEENRPPSIQFVDRQGRDLAVRGAQALDPVPISDLPVHLRQAILATEDRRFYAHAGIDPYGLARASLANLKAGRIVEGGSTLTQQLTKNVFLTPEQTLHRKAQEMIVAIWLERRFTKNEILRLYLSRVYFGNGAWGVEAASQSYFGRSPEQISLPEAALLAGLLKAPSALNPIYNPQGSADRMRTVLRSMERQKLFGDRVLEQALSAPVQVRAPGQSKQPSFFIDWIWPEIEAEVGIPNRDLVIQVSLDRDLQTAAQHAVARHLDADKRADQAALVLLDNDGAVLAMVGGADYSKSQFNRAIQAKRQPGSSFKPVVYLAALRAGLRPWTERVDAPITVDGWTPRNFKPEFLGTVSLEDALALSVNTVAVGVSEEIGRDRIVETAASLGLDKLKPYASLPLGAQGASVMDMAEVYHPFATQGHAYSGYGLISIATGTGVPLFDRTPTDPVSVLTPEEVRHMNRMLVRTIEAGTGRKARIDGRDLAGKTGTTNDHRDAWFVGYAPGTTLAVWVGNDENKPMKRVTGGTIPATIFRDVMAATLADRPIAALPQLAKPNWAVRQAELSSLLDRLEQATRETRPPVPTAQD